MQKRVSNNHRDRARLIHPSLFRDDLFTNDEIAKIIEICGKQGVERGTTNGVLNEAARKSNIKFHNRTNETAWIFDRFNKAIDEINHDFYNFDLDGYSSFQYGEYEASEAGKYDFHMDMFPGFNLPAESFLTRKLSVTFLLTEPGVDFEGGDFQTCLSQEKNAETIKMKKGRMVIFPSFIIHRVTPVTKGTRKSIVIWVDGPKFK